MERCRVYGRGVGLAAGRRDLHGAGGQLLAPLADPMGVDVEVIGELGQRGIAFQRGDLCLCFKAGE